MFDHSSIKGFTLGLPKFLLSSPLTYRFSRIINKYLGSIIRISISRYSSTISFYSSSDDFNLYNTDSSLNKFSFVISDVGATAAELIALQAKTSVAVDADNIGATATGIEASSASDITSLYTGTVVPTGIADAKISVNDTTINATTLNTINGYTTGDVTVTALTISGPVADIETALTASGSGIVFPSYSTPT